MEFAAFAERAADLGAEPADLAVVGHVTDLLEPHVLGQTGQSVDVEPAVVFEVGYEEIQRSPTTESGSALRFPRFVAVREDLGPTDAERLERVERLADG